jgi:hypothetical protein
LSHSSFGIVAQQRAGLPRFHLVTISEVLPTHIKAIQARSISSYTVKTDISNDFIGATIAFLHRCSAHKRANAYLLQVV